MFASKPPMPDVLDSVDQDWIEARVIAIISVTIGL